MSEFFNSLFSVKNLKYILDHCIVYQFSHMNPQPNIVKFISAMLHFCTALLTNTQLKNKSWTFFTEHSASLLVNACYVNLICKFVSFHSCIYNSSLQFYPCVFFSLFLSCYCNADWHKKRLLSLKNLIRLRGC